MTKENNRRQKSMVALSSYLVKHERARAKSAKPKRKKNKSPEADFLLKELDPWLKKNGFLMDRVEAKATYNVNAGTYLNSPTTPGMSDRVGNDRFGRACFIEAKAPGSKRLRMDQREFLEKKIRSKCFAVCVQSVAEIEEYYNHFMSLSLPKAESYLLMLLNQIPVKKQKGEPNDDSPLFDD
jgi:hypothetical protein